MQNSDPLQPVVKWSEMSWSTGSGVPVKHLILGTAMLNLALHSQSPNIYDLLQLLDNKAFSKLPSEAQKMNKKEATETHYNHSNR